MTFKPLPGLVIFGDLLTEIMQHLGHRNPKKVFRTSWPGENPPKFLFLKPNPLVGAMIAEFSLKK
jgi:hypothetical protein